MNQLFELFLKAIDYLLRFVFTDLYKTDKNKIKFYSIDYIGY